MKTKVLITVDTETYTRRGSWLSPEQMICGRTGDGGMYGIDAIMSLCEARGFRATFFVDALLQYRFGRPLMGSLWRSIAARGHDVELHVHPITMPGLTRPFIADYPFEVQRDLVKEGREFIADAIGRAPAAFRAGSYGANLDTIRALEANGIALDSSYFGFHPDCMLSRQLNNRWRNRIFRIGSVTEVPVTIYRMLRPFIYRDYYSKIDVNACSGRELCYVTGALAGRIETLILFLHSFSLVRWDEGRNTLVRDDGALRKTAEILDFIAHQNNVEVVTMRELHAHTACHGDEASDPLPSTGIGMTFGRVAGRYYGGMANGTGSFDVP